ncbi:13293_t:CDS:2 [Gigaspora rosea]|nr:13293_t:CDS:2 [Gigaspora rosea]
MKSKNPQNIDQAIKLSRMSLNKNILETMLLLIDIQATFEFYDTLWGFLRDY